MNLAKITPPQPSRTLERERLQNRLLAWEDKKLIIIHAQAGQGKSTLAAAYVHSLKTPSAWYTLDRDDENPGVLLAGLGQAMQRAWPAQVPALPHLPQAGFGGASAQQDIARWINRLFEPVKKPGVIVFDDYNVVPSSRELDRILRALLDASPPHIRFIILSRTIPDLEVARMRAKRELGVITGSDLRFNDAETLELLGGVFGMPIDHANAARINRTAEGWPAGLVLMHEYLTRSPEQMALATILEQRPSKCKDHVFEYLAQEVFSHLAPGLRQFLLHTSIADSLPVRLAEQLMVLDSAAEHSTAPVSAMVRDLQSRNLFISVSDDASTIRYHTLFREFLLKKLHEDTKPAVIKKLYATAIQYFIKARDPVRAVDLSLASGQLEKAIARIEDCGQELIALGRTQTLLRWIEELPADRRDRPWFLFYRALAMRFTDPASALMMLDRALRGFRGEQRPQHRIVGQMLCLGGIIEACFHSGGDFARMERAAARAQALLLQNKQGSPAARARLLLATGTAWFFIGKLQHGTDALSQALDLFRKQGDRFYQITTALYLTPCALYQGDFMLAREAVRKGLEAQAAIPDEGGNLAALHLTKAMAALFEGKFAEAQDCIEHCRMLASTEALESITSLSLDINGWLKIAQGDYGGAIELLTGCKRKAEGARNGFFSASAAHLLAIAYLFQGKLDKALSESDYALSIQTRSGSRLFHGIYLIASGAIHLKLGEHAYAEKELLSALALLQKVKAAQQEANAHLVLALLYGKLSKPSLMNKHLRAGFSIGKERGFTYYALFNTAELTGLANTAIAGDICAGHCRDLLDSLSNARGIPRLRIFSLGGFSVTRDQALVSDAAWKSKRAKTLLKILVARDDHSLPRDLAMEMLWPSSDSGECRATFNVMLHRMRKALGPDTGTAPGKDTFCIQNENDTLRLNGDKVWTDVGEFRTRFARATRLKGQRELAASLGEYEKALSLYQGEFLPADLYSDWARDTRDHLRTLYHRALENASELAESFGDRKKAAQFYDLRFASDSCNEKACCWLMEWHQSLGQRGDAVRTYERCERALSRDMDMEPEEGTKKIYRSIIGG